MKRDLNGKDAGGNIKDTVTYRQHGEKEDNMDWIKPQGQMGRQGYTEADVSVTYSGKTQRGKSTYFTVRNGRAEDISQTGYYLLAVDGARIYFRESTREEGGWLFHKPKTTVNGKPVNPDRPSNTTRYAVFTGERYAQIHDWAKKYQGDFEMIWDSREKLWCIDGINRTGKAKQWVKPSKPNSVVWDEVEETFREAERR